MQFTIYKLKEPGIVKVVTSNGTELHVTVNQIYYKSKDIEIGLVKSNTRVMEADIDLLYERMQKEEPEEVLKEFLFYLLRINVCSDDSISKGDELYE
jgi:hypothetical protein